MVIAISFLAGSYVIPIGLLYILFENSQVRWVAGAVTDENRKPLRFVVSHPSRKKRAWMEPGYLQRAYISGASPPWRPV